MNILLLKGYNNYFNRILKKEESTSAYKTAVLDGSTLNYYELKNVNFNPNDGIATELIIGEGDLSWDDKTSTTDLKREGKYNPDYAIVYDNEVINIHTTKELIYSRWFVTECERTRKGQYRIALQRDVLADFEEALDSPCFIEKGTIDSTSNPLLFNPEGMKFNEIKKDELLIKDNTKCAWLVGYVKKDIDQAVQGITYVDPNDLGTYVKQAADIPFSLDCFTFVDKSGNITQNATKKLVYLDTYDSRVKMRLGHGGAVNSNERISMNFAAVKAENYRSDNVDWQNLNSTAMTMSQSSILPISADVMKNIGEDVILQSRTSNNTYFEYLKQDAIARGADLEIITDTTYIPHYFLYDNKVYLTVIPRYTEFSREEYYTGEDTAAVNYLNGLQKTYGAVTLSTNTSNPARRKIKVEIKGQYYPVIAQEVELGSTLTYDFPASSSRASVADAQYNIFAMPIMPSVLGMPVGTEDIIRFQYDNSGTTVEIDISSISRYQLAMANAIMTKLGGDGTASKAYDLQLLPYCPFELDVGTASYPERTVIDLDSSGLTAGFDYDLIKDANDDTKGIIFFARSANFTKDIELPELSENSEISLRNMEVREEELTITNPTFTYNNTDYQGLPLFRMSLPYKVADAQLTMDAVTLPSAISTGLVNSFISPVLTEGTQPAIYFTNSNMPGPYSPGEQVTFTDSEIKVLAHWILPDNALGLKVENECDFQRLVSPNYNGMFQFKKARMVDGIHTINVDCTYKPYAPYIKLNPDFSGLYGRDWNDSTGLICAGDFSLPMINDQFINYALQNKNYQAIFARGIENLDVNQQIAREQQDFKGIFSTITGGATGAIAGASKGGVYGAMAGAAVGTAVPLIKYQMEKGWLERQQSEARDFAVDNFNYQLGNIQALPQSITKSSPLSYNNKVWPILEFFSCTDEEKEVLKNKLKYDGMTIMAIGRLNDYLVSGGYVKGKMIRLEGIKDDSHVADAIYQAVDRGFYKGE